MKCSCVSNFWSCISPALTQNFSADDWNVSFRTFCIGGFSNKLNTVLVTGLKTDLINQSQPKTVESERLRLFTFSAYTRIKQGKGKLWSSPVTTSRTFHLQKTTANRTRTQGLCSARALPGACPLETTRCTTAGSPGALERRDPRPKYWEKWNTKRWLAADLTTIHRVKHHPGWKSGCCLPLLVYTAFRRRKIKPSAHGACEERGEETPKAVDIHKVIF